MCQNETIKSIVNKTVADNSSDVWVCNLKPCSKLVCSARVEIRAGYSPGSYQYIEYTDLRGKIRVTLCNFYTDDDENSYIRLLKIS